MVIAKAHGNETTLNRAIGSEGNYAGLKTVALRCSPHEFEQCPARFAPSYTKSWVAIERFRSTSTRTVQDSRSAVIMQMASDRFEIFDLLLLAKDDPGGARFFMNSPPLAHNIEPQSEVPQHGCEECDRYQEGPPLTGGDVPPIEPP